MFEFSYHDQLQFVLFAVFWFGWCWIASPCKKVAEDAAEDVVQDFYDDPLYDDEYAEESAEIIRAQSSPTQRALLDALEQCSFANAIDYTAMSIRELKAECKLLTGTPRAIKGYSKLTKAELIARLSA